MPFDDALVAALRDDPRMTVSDLAERLATSRAAVSARLEQLKADGAVAVVAAVHPEFLGLTSFAHLAIRTSGRADDIAGAIGAMPASAFVSAVSGSHQLVAELRLPGPAELYAAIADIRALGGVESVNTLTYVDITKGTFMPAHPLPGGLSVDETDLALIRLLQADGRATYVSLAESVGMSASATRKRVNALIDAEVVRIGPMLSRARHEAGVIAGIGLNVRGSGESVVERLAAEPRLEFLARTIGRHDILATIAARSLPDLHAFLEGLTDSPEISEVESWLHLRVLKERYEWPLPTLTELADRMR
ncbi:Lrp/AsnC family transcriptional regulator [Nocardioides ginsengisoli]|uniref:Lrp/AsnC family transcriptional regulator n=1 Tax=Nocardioides ginsengisoli TaxID=363868 RepID=A0ABW3W205_9ACTN